MLDTLRRLITGQTGRSTPTEQPAPGPEEIQLAAAALLLELAYADGEFSPQERGHIEASLARHFNLDSATVQELLALAGTARQASIDHFQFTQRINAQLDTGQKLVLAEVMWGVILADGTVGDHEAYLVRKIARLLDLEPGYLAEARRKASRASDG